jgi:hypothetical protein
MMRMFYQVQNESLRLRFTFQIDSEIVIVQSYYIVHLALLQRLDSCV